MTETACPVCTARYASATDALGCWLYHTPKLLSTRTRRDIAAALGVGPSNISMAIRALGITTRKPSVRRTP